MFKRLFGWLSGGPTTEKAPPGNPETAPSTTPSTPSPTGTEATKPSPQPRVRRERSASAGATLPFISICEVDDAAPLAGALFLQKFKHPIPDYPRHFVAIHEMPGGTRAVVAYVHYLAHDDVYLCGGMCVDGAAYRRFSTAEMAALRTVGSLAEYLLRQTFEMIGPCAAIFGSVGDATARNVDLRAGFIDTGEPHLMVVWRDATDAEKPALVAKVKALGGF